MMTHLLSSAKRMCWRCCHEFFPCMLRDPRVKVDACIMEQENRMHGQHICLLAWVGLQVLRCGAYTCCDEAVCQCQARLPLQA